MIEIKVSDASARLLRGEVLTSGRVGLRCRLYFDDAWDGLRRIAVILGSEKADLLLESDEFTIPAACLARPGEALSLGFYGMSEDGTQVIPTVWVNCGEIRAGAAPTESTAPEDASGLLTQLLAAAEEAVRTAAQLRQDAADGRFTGACFTPSVSAQGVLSWTNDGGAPNPPSVNITAAVLAALPDGDEVMY